MPEPWYRPLAGLRDEFAARKEDLRHLLLTVDRVACLLPENWDHREPGEDYSRWGLPPEHFWRIEPGNEQPRAIIEQVTEYGSPLVWKHTFYGRDAAAREPFLHLAYRVHRCFVEASESEYTRLSESLGLPIGRPEPRHPEPSLWWMRAVHGIAGRRPANSSLWSEHGPARHFHDLGVTFEAHRLAQEQGRADSGEFSYSILHADVFACSAKALDLIRAASDRGETIPLPTESATEPPDVTEAEPLDLVTLDQAAVKVYKSKRTLERWKTKGELPDPVVRGGRGTAHMYDWKVLGPWLTKRVGIKLPEKFPRLREG